MEGGGGLRDSLEICDFGIQKTGPEDQQEIEKEKPVSQLVALE